MDQSRSSAVTRRRVLETSALVASGAVLAGCDAGPAAPAGPSPGQTGATASATEDLMGEHGLLQRVLLVYDAVTGRLETGEQLHGLVRIVQRLIHHHERLEEVEVFPRVGRAGQLGETISVLTLQHQRGAQVTDHILDATSRSSLTGRAREQLATAMSQFTRMYRPHEAREDTEVFPALRQALSAGKFAELSERFTQTEPAMAASPRCSTRSPPWRKHSASTT